jgi:hypothetical protein
MYTKIHTLNLAMLVLGLANIAQAQNGFSFKADRNQKFPLLGVVNLSTINDPWSATVTSLAEAPEAASGLDEKKILLAVKKNEFLQKQSLAKQTQAINISAASASPFLKSSFTANTGNNVPNDNTVAISNGGLVVNMVNTLMRVYTTAGVLKTSKALKAFAAPLGTFNSISDPRVVYDPVADRFIALFFNGTTSLASQIIIGFSKTNDPALQWNLYTLSGNNQNDSTWSDYPIVSITNNDLCVTFNQLKSGNPDWRKAFRYSIIWQINKQDGYAGNPLTTNYWHDIKYNNKPIWNICAVQGGSAPAGPETYFISLRPSDLDNDTVFLHKIDNSVASGIANFTSVQLSTNTHYGLPPNAKQKTGDWLQTNDARVLSAFVENGKIHYVHNTIDPVSLNSAIYHGVISNLSSTPVITGSMIRSDTMNFAYPSIAYAGASAFDDALMINCSYLPDNGFAGTAVFYVDNAGSVSNILEVKKGGSNMSYLNVNTSTHDTLERWGDYSGIQRDYTKPGAIWLSGSYTGTTPAALYSTWLARIDRTDTLNIGIKGTETQSNLKAYPNPSDDRVSVQFETEHSANARFTLFDVNGKLITVIYEGLIMSGINVCSFDVAQLSSGFYFLKVTDNNGIVANKKIVVQH